MSGRPSEYDPAVCATICERIVNGESLRNICRSDDMPVSSTVFVWLQNNREFAEQYARAREAQADTLADELLDIADDATNDWMERQLRDGSTETVPDTEHINRSRLRVDTRKWIAAKLKPKKYGDSSSLSLSDPDGKPLAVTVAFVNPKT